MYLFDNFDVTLNFADRTDGLSNGAGGLIG